jgi:hypothetical protein
MSSPASGALPRKMSPNRRLRQGLIQGSPRIRSLSQIIRGSGWRMTTDGLSSHEVTRFLRLIPAVY